MAEEVLKKWHAEHKKMLDEVVADEKTLEDLYVQPEYRRRADVRLDGVRLAGDTFRKLAE